MEAPDENKLYSKRGPSRPRVLGILGVRKAGSYVP